MANTDHWRTHPEDYAGICSYFDMWCEGGTSEMTGFYRLLPDLEGNRKTRVPACDLDVASNAGSVLPCRVAYHHSGGPVSQVAAEVVLQTPVSVGGGAVESCGVTFAWDPRLSVWCNGPYSAPAPMVAQLLVHAYRGGRGVGLFPGNLLDAAWGQALMYCAGVPRVVMGQVPVSTVHSIFGPLFQARGVPSSLQAQWYMDLVRAPPVGRVGLYFPSRRLGYIDLDGTPKFSNRIGTMVVAWGVGPDKTGVHTVALPKPSTGQWPALNIASSSTGTGGCDGDDDC